MGQVKKGLECQAKGVSAYPRAWACFCPYLSAAYRHQLSASLDPTPSPWTLFSRLAASSVAYRSVLTQQHQWRLRALED